MPNPITRPGVELKINGNVQNITSLNLSEPRGAAGAELTFTFADPNVSLADTLSSVQVKTGYYDNSGNLHGFVRFKESNLQRDRDFTVQRLGDNLTVRVTDRVARMFQLAPSETITYGSDAVAHPLTVYDAVKWLYEQLGLTAKLGGIPFLPIDPFDITPFETYHGHAQRLVGGLDPLIAPDGLNNSIIITTEAGLDDVAAGSSHRLALQATETLSKNTTPYPIVTQLEIRYKGGGIGAGSPLEGGCGIGSSGYSGISRPGGAYVLATSDLCGNVRLTGDQILGMYGDRVAPSTTVDTEVLLPDGLSVGEFSANALFADLVPDGGTVLTTTTHYLNFLNDEGDVERSVEYKTVQRQWGAAGDFLSELVSEVTAETYFLPGYNFEYSTGHKTVTNARTDIPGAGTQFINNLLVEDEQVRLEIWSDDPTKWRKVGSRKITRGWVNYPSGTPLHNANLNGTIDTSNTTTETPVPDVLISQQTERVSQGPLKNQLKWTITTFNYVPRPGIHRSTTQDVVGKQALEGEAEIFTYPIVRDDLAETWGGHRAREVIDVTQWGDAGLGIGLWLAEQKFARVGEYRTEASLTSPYVYGWAYRGMKLDMEERDDAAAYLYVLGVNLSFTGLETRAPTIRTTLDGIWQENPGGFVETF